MSSWAPTRYKTTNWSSCNEALKQRGSLSIWFDPRMIWTPPPAGKRGRRCQFSNAAIQTRLTLKVLFGMPLRQTTGFVQSLLRLVGQDWAVPDFSTLCRRQRQLNVAITHRGGVGSLNLLIPSRDIAAQCPAGKRTARASRPRVRASGTPVSPLSHMLCMCCRAAGGPKRRIWRKVHIGIDEETLEVRAVEATGSNIGPSRRTCHANRLPGSGYAHSA